MAQMAAHQVDYVFPYLPAHRWQIDCRDHAFAGVRLRFTSDDQTR